jgi:hypothetical protein
MTGKLRAFLLVQAVVFFAASLSHFGILMQGFEHRRAAIAESVIGAVLSVGLLISYVRASTTRRSALIVQSFALLGTCVGVTMIIIGVGPQTGADKALHAVMLALLISGLVVAAKARPAS